MKHFTRHPSKVTAATDILSFKCPGCKNKTLYSAEQDVHKVADVDENELFICDECGGEFRAHPQYNGSIRFTESIESATSVDDKKIDRRLSSTSKRYKGYRISLDNRHECYNIYDAHGELEDHGFKSVDDAMAHIDELVSIKSATDVDEIPDFNDWLYDKYGVGDADLTDDDWEYYHDKYLKETGQEQYMSGNVYSSKEPGVRRKSTHHPVTAAKKRTTRQGEFDDRHIRNKVDSSTDIDLSEYDYSGNVDGYFVYRKVITQPDGSKKGVWVAQDQDEKNPPFSITYDQARGFDPINDTSGTKKLAKWLGKRLLPNSVESSKHVKASTYPQGTYWMAKYKDMNGNLHKIVFQFDSQDFDEAEEEMDAVIPEPYTAGRLLGRCNPELAEKDGFVVLSNQDIHCAEEIEDYEDDIQEISQEFTSENTSINSSKLPAIFKMISLEPGTINIDYGGGRFDNVADYLTQFDVINLVYDPYNRTPEHNKEVIRTVRKAGGADTATCSNVLNVIKEPEVRQNVLQNIKKLVKPNGTVYITVYEGSGRGNEGPTKSGYQLNRKTEDYLDEIKQVFPDAVRKGKLIVAHPNGSAVTSAEDLSYGALTCEDCTYDLWTLVQDDNGKWVREDRIGTYDDYDEAETVAEALAKDTPCQVIEVGPNGLALVWTSKVSDPAIIEWLHDEYTMGNTKYSQLVSDLVDNFSISTDEADQIISDWVDKDDDVHLEYDEELEVEASVNIDAATDSPKIPSPYDQYFVIENPDPDQLDLQVGEKFPGYGCIILAYLAPKPEYEDVIDVWPILIDDPEYPVCEWVGYRLYNVETNDLVQKVQQRIFDFLDSYGSYDNIEENITDVCNQFGLSPDEAKRHVVQWMQESGMDPDSVEDQEDVEGASSVSSASGRKHSIKTLHDALLNRASQVMRMNGFPLNEIADYLVVDIQPAEDGWLNCEVRAELSYEGMSDMIDALNPIVQKYDKDAYFDHVTGGIISAYLPSGKFNAIQSATDTNSSKVFELVQYTPDSGENGPAGDDFDVVDWGEFESEEAAKAHWSAEIQDGTHFVREGNPSDYIEEATVLGAWGVDDYPEPPESDEPEERNSREEIIIDLDDDIVVEDNGDSVEFLRDPAFLEDEDEWTPEDEPMFQIDDGDSVYEHVMDLIIDSIPAVDGKYHIKGRIKLVYDVTLSYYYEGTSEEDQTTELNKDGCSSDYDNYRSEVIELDVTEI